MTTEHEDNWRNDPGLSSKVIYKKKFAIFPKKCQDGTVIWWKNYYTKYQYWGFKHSGIASLDILNSDNDLHEDKLESVTEAEYIVRKLTEGI